jgi:hypothetical protein
MAGWGDEVEKSMNTIVTETWVTLNTGFLCKNIIVLSLEVTNDFAKAYMMLATIPLGPLKLMCPTSPRCQSGPQSLVCRRWSERCGFLPHPIPTLRYISTCISTYDAGYVLRTNGDRLDSDTFLEVCVCRIVGIFSLKDFLSA